jgi:hypothetical protein
MLPVLPSRDEPIPMSDEHDDESGPFRRDRRYRVRKVFECFASHYRTQVFSAGQTLEWLDYVDSLPYDSVTQHRFRIRGSDELLVWETGQGEDRLQWTEFFEELPCAAAPSPSVAMSRAARAGTDS